MLFFDMFRQDPEFVRVKRGEVLFREGEDGEAMYVLIEGEAEVTIAGLFFEKCTSGSFVGEMAVIDGSPRVGTVTATKDCKFVVIDRDRFHFLVDEAPRFAIDVMRVMADRLRKCDQRILASASEVASSA